MRYISQDEIDQVRMQVWNILDNASRIQYLTAESNVIMVDTVYNHEQDRFEINIELEHGLTRIDVYDALATSLMFVESLSFVTNGAEDWKRHTLFSVRVEFNQRFFFRPLYLPYSKYNEWVVYENTLKCGLPLYQMIVPPTQKVSSFIDELKVAIPSFYLVQKSVFKDCTELLFGSLLTPPDEQMDFAAPTGNKFGKGKELREVFPE